MVLSLPIIVSSKKIFKEKNTHKTSIKDEKELVFLDLLLWIRLQRVLDDSELLLPKHDSELQLLLLQEKRSILQTLLTNKKLT
jgi:hypothetical protein